MIPIEHDCEGLAELLVQRLEIATREHSETGQVLGRKLRQAHRLAVGSRFRSRFEVKEKGSDIDVGFVQLVPQ